MTVSPLCLKAQRVSNSNLLQTSTRSLAITFECWQSHVNFVAKFIDKANKV